jgi:hypothetical protein
LACLNFSWTACCMERTIRNLNHNGVWAWGGMQAGFKMVLNK